MVPIFPSNKCRPRCHFAHWAIKKIKKCVSKLSQFYTFITCLNQCAAEYLQSAKIALPIKSIFDSNSINWTFVLLGTRSIFVLESPNRSLHMRRFSCQFEMVQKNRHMQMSTPLQRFSMHSGTFRTWQEPNKKWSKNKTWAIIFNHI